MRRGWAVVGSLGLVAVVAAANVGACSSFEGEDGGDASTSETGASETGGSEAGADGGTVDAFAEGSADAGLPPGVVFEDDFTARVATCTGWRGTDSTINPAPGEGLDGGDACLVCAPPGTTYYGMALNDGLAIEPGHTYYAEARVRGATTDAGGRQGIIRLLFAGDGGEPAYVNGSDLAYADTWQQIQVNGKVPSRPLGIGFSLYASNGGACTYIDRVLVRRID